MFLHKGEDSKPNEIAPIILLQVCRVGSETNSFLLCIRFDFLSCGEKDRTDNVVTFGWNAGKTADACTSEKMQQNGFSIVISVMCGCYLLEMFLGTKILKKLITQFPTPSCTESFLDLQ